MEYPVRQASCMFLLIVLLANETLHAIYWSMKYRLVLQDYNFISQSCEFSTTSNIKQATGRDLQAKIKNNQATSNQNKQPEQATSMAHGYSIE